MTNFAVRRLRCLMLPLIPLVAVAAPGLAQNIQSPSPSPSPAPPPNLIPGLETFSLPPGPGTTVIRPTPTPEVRPSPTSTTPSPATSPAESSRSVRDRPPERRPRPLPTPEPSPTAAGPEPVPAPAPSATPQPAVSAPGREARAVVPEAEKKSGTDGRDLPWDILGGVAAVLLLAGGLLLWARRRRRPADDDEATGGEPVGSMALDAAGGAFDPLAESERSSAAPAPSHESHATFNLGATTSPDGVGATPARRRGPHAIFNLGLFAPSDEAGAAPAPGPRRGPHETFDLDEAAPPDGAGATPARRRGPHATFNLGAVVRPDGAGIAEDMGDAAAMAPIPPPPIAPAPARAILDVGLRVRRAGTNLTGAAVEYEFELSNAGATTALGVSCAVHLLSAGANQDARLAALFAAAIDQPVVMPFDLPPGATMMLGGIALLPREGLGVMTMEGRALFVPVLAINLLYAWDGGRGQTATSHVVGIDRGEGAKMAPFRLDGAPRMFDRVAQLAYPLTIRR